MGHMYTLSFFPAKKLCFTPRESKGKAHTSSQGCQCSNFSTKENCPQPLGPPPPPRATHLPLGHDHTGHGTERRCRPRLPCVATDRAGITAGVAQEGLSDEAWR